MLQTGERWRELKNSGLLTDDGKANIKLSVSLTPEYLALCTVSRAWSITESLYQNASSV